MAYYVAILNNHNQMLLPLLLVVVRWISWLWARLVVYSRKRFLSASGVEIIHSSLKVDEEHLPHYKPGRFYPVYLRSTFDLRYHVLSKLGYGSCSTVWLARDIMFVRFCSNYF